MPEELSREIQKLEVRLQDFLKEKEEFGRELRKCIEKFKELNQYLGKLKKRPSPEEVEELMELRLEATKAFNEALKRGSKAEHEESHLLESYGALALTLEEEFQRLRSSDS